MNHVKVVFLKKKFNMANCKEDVKNYAFSAIEDENVNEICMGVKNLKVKNSPDQTMVTLKGGYQLLPHQKEVIEWMKHREELPRKTTRGVRGGIVSLCMGLGKTLTALAYSFQNKASFPTLVVTSKTVMHEWKTEGIEKFFDTDTVNVLYLHRDFIGKSIDKVDREQVMKYDMVITTYDVCMSSCRRGKFFLQCLEYGEKLMKDRVVAINIRKRRDANLPNLRGTDVIYGTPWERVICDESQRYANPATMTYKCIMAVYGRYRWCLTGTPIRNYETDIWAQLRFCGYNGISGPSMWKKSGLEMFKEHNLISTIFMMSYEDAKIELPEKIENTIVVELCGQHKDIYEDMLVRTRELYRKMMNDLCSFSCVLAMFTRLRQCAIAPYLITPQAKRATKDEVYSDWCLDKNGGAGIESSKIAKIVEIIREVTATTRVKEGKVKRLSDLAMKSVYANYDLADVKKMLARVDIHTVTPPKVIVFSMFTSCLDLLNDAVIKGYPEFKFVQVDGDTTDRFQLLDQFRRDSETQGLFLTYKVGSEGLNLTEATHCICIEPWWTNAVHNQAKARLWRTGQTKPVFIHNVVIKDSIEENIIKVCEGKDDMASSYLEGTERKLQQPGLDKFTLGKMLGF